MGRVLTAKAQRAGYGVPKNSAYTPFIAAKSPISASRTVVFTTLSIPEPASSRIDFILVSDCLVWASTPPSGNAPVAGSMGSWPDTNMNPLDETAWLYGPIAAGAFSVLICFMSFDLLLTQIYKILVLISYYYGTEIHIDMKRTAVLVALVLLATVTMSAQQPDKPLSRDGYVDYLYSYMPLPDSLVNPRQYWEEVVDKTLEVRNRMNWGIPEKEFRHFVLPVRVNNEDLDRFRAVYADVICERVKGMSLHDAVLEINHWCHEWVTYVGTDARTRGPLALMKSGEGRCGEESTFTVSALRAAGIPARQIYTPLWAHTESNHAWVEAWVDGKWYFLGACEPDPELNMGWFNAAVSRALLLHTKVSGDYHGDENVIVKNPVYTEINVIRNYVPARLTTVTVVDKAGKPVPGIDVEYKIFNSGSFGTVCKIATDKEGKARLDTGYGDMLAWASDGVNFGLVELDREDVTLCLDHVKGDIFTIDMDMVPPVENPIPNNATKEQIEANAIRTAYEDSLRKARHNVDHAKALEEEFYALVKKDCPGKMGAAEAVVRSMSGKDKGEYGVDILLDAISTDSDNPLVLSPRIGTEMLYPYKKEISEGLSGKVSSPEELMKWIEDNITVVDGSRNPQSLKIPPIYVWRSRICDNESLGIFYVAACRALGWPARTGMGGKASVLKDGAWIDVDLDKSVAALPRQGEVKIASADGGPAPRFGEFSVSAIEEGRAVRSGFRMPGGRPGGQRGPGNVGQGGPRPEPKLEMDEGYYMVMTGKRLEDGSVLARMSTFNVESGKTTEIPVSVRAEKETPLEVIGHIDSQRITGKDKFILALVRRNGEPTVHVLRQLEGDPNAIIVKPGDQSYDLFKTMIERACGADPKSIPYVIVADKAGNVYYFSQGYNTTLREGIDRVFSKIR